MPTDPSTRDPSRPAKVVRVGKYEVVAHIGKGGTSSVYRARDTETGREVALKVLNKKTAARDDALRRLHAEARNAAQLRHENIVSVYEVGEIKDGKDGIIYLAMEFIDGLDLADYIGQQGKLGPEEARQITFQAGGALLHAYKRGIVHRDIKPSNFLLARKEGELIVKLTDLGLSRQMTDDEARITREGFTVGTIDYIAPEQARDSRAADTRSDIYSLGCTLYHMLTGRPPFPEGGLGERIYKHLEVEPPDVREFSPGVPVALARVVHRMLAKKPEDRFQTPRELMLALSQAEQKLPDIGRVRKRKALRLSAEIRGPRLKPDPPAAEPLDGPAAPASVQPGPRVKFKEPIEEPKKAAAPKPKARKKLPKRQSLYLGIGGGAVLFVLLVLLIVRPWKSGDSLPEDPDPADPGIVTRPPDIPDKPPDPIVPPKDPGKDPPERAWPPLRADNPVLDKEGLARTFSEGWEEKPVPVDLPVYRVRRQPAAGQYGSLAAAARAVQEKGGLKLGGEAVYDAIIEVEDNGPLHETSFALTGKNVLIRAAAGYRPLLCWDIEREREKPLPPLVSVQDGRLTLEGLEFVLPANPPVAESRAAFARSIRGDFTARRCIFSAAGNHPGGIAVFRLEGGAKDGKPARCRLSRCLTRGGSLNALDLISSACEVLIDDSLLTTAETALLDVSVRAGDKVKLLLLRSTLVSRSGCVRIKTDDPATLPSETLELHAWDALLARSGPGREGVLLDLPAKLRKDALRWRASNCLYTGWKDLLRGPAAIDGADGAAWDRHWSSFRIDRVENAGWPSAAFPELAEVSAAEYSTQQTPGAPVGFAATSWPCLGDVGEQAPPTIGCPITRLPPARERWRQWAAQRYIPPPAELLTSSTPPEIATAMDGLYHGARIDLTSGDLGASLEKLLGMRRFAPRIVLHLYRTPGMAVQESGPIRFKDADVVLYLEPFKKGMVKDALPERLLLQSAAKLVRDPGAFIEIENGNLDVIGGEIKSSDFAHLIKIKGGSLRLHDVRLTGPMAALPGFEGLILFHGAELPKQPEGRERIPYVAVNESVLVSGRSGIVVQGAYARVRLSQSAVAVGLDAIAFEPGAEAQAKRNLSCSLENVTMAAARSAVRVGRTGGTGLPADPIVIQTRSCALLNPFAGKAGLLLCEPDALPRGGLLWQGEQDLFDRRIHFGAATLQTIPETAEGLAGWLALWGPNGAKRATLDYPHTGKFDAAPWLLEKLALGKAGSPEAGTAGADLVKLGILRKPR